MRGYRGTFGRFTAARSILALAVALGAAGCDTQAGRDASDSLAMIIGLGERDPKELRPVDPNAPPPQAPAKCPSVVIREGTETYRLYERGFDGDAAHVVYQGGVIKVARECEFIDGNAIRIKVGVAGRVITGPKWTGGPVQLPLRAALVRTGGEAAWSQLYDIQPTMIPGENTIQFSHVEENIYFEVPEGDHINNYVVYVGFDDMARTAKRS